MRNLSVCCSCDAAPAPMLSCGVPSRRGRAAPLSSAPVAVEAVSGWLYTRNDSKLMVDCMGCGSAAVRAVASATGGHTVGGLSARASASGRRSGRFGALRGCGGQMVCPGSPTSAAAASVRVSSRQSLAGQSSDVIARTSPLRTPDNRHAWAGTSSRRRGRGEREHPHQNTPCW